MNKIYISYFAISFVHLSVCIEETFNVEIQFAIKFAIFWLFNVEKFKS